MWSNHQHRIFWLLFWFGTMGILGCAASEAARSSGKFVYPKAQASDAFDDYHGVKVPDPYRWLEDGDSPRTRAWVEEQNLLTQQFLDTPWRRSIQQRLTEIWNFPKYSIPVKKGGRYFFEMNQGLQNQSVWYVQDGLKSPPRVILDPNPLSQDGTVAVNGVFVSEDGKLMAYLLTQSGSDRQELRIKKADTGEDYPEVLRYCKFSSVAWKRDGSGFFYNRFPDPQTVAAEDQNKFNRVYWHEVGTSQERDALVFEQPDDKDLSFSPVISEDGDYVVLTVYRGTDPKNRIYYRKVESTEPFVRLLDAEDARYEFLGNRKDTFYLLTDLNAPRGRVIALDLKNPEKNKWREIMGEQADVMDAVGWIYDRLVIAAIHDVKHELRVYDLEGRFIRKLPLPGMGTVMGISGRARDPEMFFGFSSYLHPIIYFRYDFLTDTTELFRGPQISFDSSGYETEQVFYPSKDGTQVSMFITRKKGMVLDGKNPVLLYGYGGFNVSLMPQFWTQMVLWFEHGGAFAVANLRGGNEYGESWHQAGILNKKQNVFDDFIAAAEWLIQNRYTSSSRLAILGGSNGGLLVSACMVERPDLYGAVVSMVPVIDMLRYHKFSVGSYWESDYGNAEKNPEHFKFLYAYSPLHNLKPGVAYPPVLVTTADHDDRVVPMHARKFVAALQAVSPGANPVLLRVDTKAGHGQGKPTTKKIEEWADIFTFLFKSLGMPGNNN